MAAPISLIIPFYDGVSAAAGISYCTHQRHWPPLCVPVVPVTPGETPGAEWSQDYTATYEGTVQQQYNTEDVRLLQRR